MKPISRHAPQTVDEAERAAVMVMLLEDDQAARSCPQLEPRELRLLGEKMCALGEIGPEVIAQAIAGFVEKTESWALSRMTASGQVRFADDARGGRGEGRQPDAAHPARQPRGIALELARWLTPQALSPLVKGEHPQAHRRAAGPARSRSRRRSAARPARRATQPEVVHRIATLGPVSPDAIAMLEELLTAGSANATARPRFPWAARAKRPTSSTIRARPWKSGSCPKSPASTRRWRARSRTRCSSSSTFSRSTPQSMGALLREVDSDTLIDALKGIAEEERDVLLPRHVEPRRRWRARRDRGARPGQAGRCGRRAEADGHRRPAPCRRWRDRVRFVGR
jgi:flagellar motor switch protein FliG